MDKLTALRVFRRIVERQSFSRAARDLALSNAAVSKNLRELEEALGATLIQRTTRRLRVTPLGETYYRRAVEILESIADADRAVLDHARTLRGLLRVSCPMSLGLAGVAAAATDFLVRHPEVKLDLVLDDRLVDLVREGFDVCIRGGDPLPDSGLVARRLAPIERVLVAAPSYVARVGEPRTPRDLARHRCLVYSLSRTPARWTFVKGARTQAVVVDGPLQMSSSLALVQAAAAGLGVAFVPRLVADQELAAQRVIPLLRDWQGEPQALNAIYLRHRHTPTLLRRFVEHLEARLGARGDERARARSALRDGA